MKTILISTSVSFLLMLAGLTLYARHLAAPPAETPPALTTAGHPVVGEGVDLQAAGLAIQAAEAERIQLAQQREEVAALRGELALRESALQQQREHIEKAVVELRELQGAYRAAHEQSTTKLAKMFDAMKSDGAAAILASLDTEIALEVLARMKERAAAKVLAELPPAKAASLSERLSLGRGR